MKNILSLSAVTLGLRAGTFTPIIANADTTNNHVSTYHLTTDDGWSNDLQTIVWNEQGKYYDIYFLHSKDGADNPFGPSGQNWYHTTTKDFIHFTKQNEAISAFGPEAPFTWKSAWTGSVITNQGNIKGVPKGAKVSYFSGLEKHDGGTQNIWAAWSDDNGKTFKHVLNDVKPVIDHSWDWTASNHSDERDPAVFYWHGKMLMYVAEGNEIGVYQSTDGLNWKKADENGASKIGMGTFMQGLNQEDAIPVECPAVRTMKLPNGKTKQVLFYGGKSPKSGQTTGTYYIVGHLDKNGLFAPETDAKRLDQGSDYYGANFSGTDDLSKVNDSIISMGWVGNWNYTANGVHDESANSAYAKRLGSYTLGRKLTLNNDLSIKQTPIYSGTKNTKTYKNVSADKPVNGVNGTVNQKISRGTDTNGTVWNLLDVPNLSMNKMYDLKFTNTKGNYQGRIYIDIWQGGDWVRLNYDPSNGNYVVNSRAGELDKGLNGQVGSSYYYDGLLGNGNGYLNNNGVKNKKNINLKVFTDKNSVKFFFPNGQSYTVARYSTSDKQDFKIYTEDPTNGNKVDIQVNDIN